MRVSLSELLTTVTKACVGNGVSPGVAQDMGKACVALAQSDEPSINSVLKALDEFDALAPPADWEAGDQGCKTQKLCVLSSGPSMVDLALLGDASKPAVAEEVDYPDLIRALASTTGRRFSFVQNEKSVTLSFEPQTDSQTSQQIAGGCEVDEDEWTRLTRYAALIMVPADETNRADAGAGLTDND